MTEHYPLTVNGPDATARVAAALRSQFGDDRVRELPAPVSASEDFGSFGTEWGVPSIFWYVGGTDAALYREAEQAGRVAQDIPTNHNAKFAPVLHPTLETGVQAMTTASLDALGGWSTRPPAPELSEAPGHLAPARHQQFRPGSRRGSPTQ